METDGARARSRRGWMLAILGFLGVAGLTVLLLAFLGNIFERKQEARQHFLRVVEITEDTLDPKIWGQNWPYEYDSHLKTALPTTTKYGGRGLHACALFDQEQTRRVTEKQQPGACIQCHASNLALYRFVGKGEVMKGFEIVSGMSYQTARDMRDDKGQPLVQH